MVYNDIISVQHFNFNFLNDKYHLCKRKLHKFGMAVL